MSAESSSAGSFPPVTVLIPLHRDGEIFRICLTEMMEIDYPNYRVMVVTDEIDIQLPPEVHHVKTGSQVATPPGVKRDVGMASTEATYVAFIDDDAYPTPEWLSEAVRILEEDVAVAGVGGPGLTPPGSGFRERASGATYQSFFGSGPLRFRFLPQEPRSVDDLPAYNFVARASSIRSIGGWASTFYGGEDTKLCLELIRNGFNLHYSPRVVVYHFRRPVPLAHMRQVANVGMHRGYFLKRFPDTSRKLVYLMPAFLLLTIALATASALLWHEQGVLLAASIMLLGFFTVVLESLRREPLPIALTLPFFLLGHHVAYASGFLRGLFKKELSH